MELIKILKKESCEINFHEKSKELCIRKISKLMAKSVQDVSEQQIFDALMSRENSSSTGFENGIAIPHAKIPGLTEFAVAVIISKKGIEFDSIDKKKSHLFFVIIGPDDEPRQHLQILAQISRLSRIRNAQKELLAAKDVENLIESFSRFTSGVVKKEKLKEKQKLFLVVLNELRFYDDILEIFIGKGIVGVNVIDSSGVKNQLSEIPLFADFLNFLGERTDNRKTIMAVLPESEIENITLAIEEVMGDLDKHTGALVMALNVPFIKGTLES